MSLEGPQRSSFLYYRNASRLFGILLLVYFGAIVWQWRGDDALVPVDVNDGILAILVVGTLGARLIAAKIATRQQIAHHEVCHATDLSAMARQLQHLERLVMEGRIELADARKAQTTAVALLHTRVAELIRIVGAKSENTDSLAIGGAEVIQLPDVKTREAFAKVSEMLNVSRGDSSGDIAGRRNPRE